MDRTLLILQAAVLPVTDAVSDAARLNDVTGARSRQKIERNARLEHGRVGIDHPPKPDVSRHRFDASPSVAKRRMGFFMRASIHTLRESPDAHTASA